MSISAFILLVMVFSIVALTASLTDNSTDNQVSYLSEYSNESKPNNASMRNRINYISDNAEEPEPENTFIVATTSRSGNESNEPETEVASTSQRVKYPRIDYNDGKDSEVEPDDSVYTDDVVE